jgi:hypothetical protein
MKKLLILPLLLGAVIALAPSPANAVPSQRGCDRNPSLPACRLADRLRERRDQQNGVTPACRAAANKVVTAKTELRRSKSDIGPWKKALKKAKTKKAKAKYAKGLKKAKKRYAKAKKVNIAGLTTAANQACASARVKPTY